MKITRIGAALLVGTSFAAGCVAASGGGVLAASAQGTDQPQTYRLVSLFNNVLERFGADYVEPVSGKTLIDNALNGMLTGLDPHSAYMTEQQWHDMQSETAGR